MNAIQCTREMLPRLGSIRQRRVVSNRLKRIREIRRKIDSGEYDLTERLDIVVDRLIEDVLR